MNPQKQPKKPVHLKLVKKEEDITEMFIQDEDDDDSERRRILQEVIDYANKLPW